MQNDCQQIKDKIQESKLRVCSFMKIFSRQFKEGDYAMYVELKTDKENNISGKEHFKEENEI